RRGVRPEPCSNRRIAGSRAPHGARGGAGGPLPRDARRAGARPIPGRRARPGAACMSNGTAVDRTELPFPLLARGKVRDVYDVGDDRLLLVATDRISAFDVVMEEPIP